MDVKEAIKKRRSVREYKSDPIPESALETILEAARLAPSAHNKQDWKFIIVKDKKVKNDLSIAARNQAFIAKAPIIIAGVALDPDYVIGSSQPGFSSGVPGYAVNLAIAMEHIALSAAEEGLGTCWIGAFSQEKVKKILEIPEKLKVVALMPLGFPADKPVPKTRKEISEIICHNKFNDH